MDALAQCEGKPMRTADVPTVLKARTTLHSNKGQALISMEFWRRAITELTAAVTIDASNAKALWRRYKAHEALKQWAEAEADLEALLKPELQEGAGPLLAAAKLGPSQLSALRETLKERRAAADAEAEETLEDRMEEATAKGVAELRERFEEITQRYGLHGNKDLAAELAEMITRPEGVTPQLSRRLPARRRRRRGAARVDAQGVRDAGHARLPHTGPGRLTRRVLVPDGQAGGRAQRPRPAARLPTRVDPGLRREFETLLMSCSTFAGGGRRRAPPSRARGRGCPRWAARPASLRTPVWRSLSCGDRHRDRHPDPGPGSSYCVYACRRVY